MKKRSKVGIIRIFVILLITLFSSLISYGQGGSNYSIFGFGDVSNAISAGYEGLAGTSVAMPSNIAINFSNPALLSKIQSTRIQLGYRFNQNIISDVNSNLWQNNGGINAISMVFALDTSKEIAASFGLIPLTKVNYSIAKSFSQGTGDETVTGTSYYKGAGGLSAFYISASSKIFGGLHLGATLLGDFGSIFNSNTVYYDDKYSYATLSKQLDYFSGIGYKFGIYYELPLNINFGAYYQDFGKMKVKREISYSSDLLADTTFHSNLNINSPKIIGLGLSYQTGKFLMGADYRILDVSNLDYGTTQNTVFKNSNEISFGLVRLGNPWVNAPVLDRSSYKFGFSYSNLYYEVASQKINELKFSFGMGIPFSESGFLDGAFVFGKRGTTNNGLVNEYFGRLVIDISIGEGWFHPFKREY